MLFKFSLPIIAVLEVRIYMLRHQTFLR